MQYRQFGRTGLMVSAVGMGANRFPESEVNSVEGIERCAQIVVDAAKSGINFFDSAGTYSFGKCEKILRMALPRIEDKCYICGKSSSLQEKTRDSVLRHIENSLNNIGIENFDFYYMWSIKSIEQYQMIMSKGGPYEGLLTARDRGLIRHICFSSHASAEDTVKIIHDGAFRGVLVSYSLLNFLGSDIILKEAEKHGLGVTLMNPLGGGIIPQNQDLFRGSYMDGDRDIVDSALKFVYSNTAVSTVLCGVSSTSELESCVESLSLYDENQEQRQTYVSSHLQPISEYCTGCGYCDKCPKGIRIPQLMTAYNQTKFEADFIIYNRTDSELVKKGNFFKKLDGIVKFDSSINPCINCGKCEKFCTQSLPIIRTISQIYGWVEESGVSVKAQKERLQNLIHSDYVRVGFYTAGVYTSYIISLYKSLFNVSNFEIIVFDSNPSKWGELYLEEIIVKNPAEIPMLSLDVLIISNYIHSEIIYNDLISLYPETNIQKLHTDRNVPWMY